MSFQNIVGIYGLGYDSPWWHVAAADLHHHQKPDLDKVSKEQ